MICVGVVSEGVYSRDGKKTMRKGYCLRGAVLEKSQGGLKGGSQTQQLRRVIRSCQQETKELIGPGRQ